MIEQLTVSVGALLFICLLPPLCAICILPGLVFYFFLISTSVSFSLLGIVLVVIAVASIPIAWLLIGELLERVFTTYRHHGVHYSTWLPCVALAMSSPELLRGETIYGLANLYLWQDSEIFFSLFLYLSSMVVKWGVFVGCSYSLVVLIFGVLSHLAGVSLRTRANATSGNPQSIYSGLLIPLSILLLAISCQYVSQQFLIDLLQPLNQR